MNFKLFWGFFYSFLTIVSFIVIPSLLIAKDYKKFVVFMLIFLFLVILSTILQVFFSTSATLFWISNKELFFKYNNGNIKTANIADICSIKVSLYRYSFILTNGRKYFASRFIAPFKLENSINTVIFDISNKYGIDIV